MNTENYYTISEAVELTGLTADSLRKLCQGRKKIKGAIKIGRNWYIPKDQLPTRIRVKHKPTQTKL